MLIIKYTKMNEYSTIAMYSIWNTIAFDLILLLNNIVAIVQEDKQDIFQFNSTRRQRGHPLVQ